MTDSSTNATTTNATSTISHGLPATPTQAVTQAAAQTQDDKVPTIAMRALIVTQDASIIIGKAGTHIRDIRENSGAKVNVSEAIPNNPERILNVSGPLDAVSKAFGLIVRRINDEPMEAPSVPGSRAVTIRFIVPHHRMGSVIGKQGSKIKEIQEASGARLQASEAMLPGSTERVLTIAGVADAIHIAVYYVGTILIENIDRQPANTPYRPAGSLGPPPSSGPRSHPYPSSSYGSYPSAPPPHPAYAGAAPPGTPAAGPGGPTFGGSTANQPGSQTQQIFIPNELVGSIIGKAGGKINEVRNLSACHIKILDQGAEGSPPGERLVVINGQPPNIQLAIQLLYARLEEEKNAQLAKTR